MRAIWFLLLTCVCFAAISQKQPGFGGLLIKLNSSGMVVHSTIEPFRASEQTSLQWSASAGIFYVTPNFKKFRLEAQLGYEAVGSGKEFFYNSQANEWVRIFDQYRTVTASLFLRRSLTKKENWYLNAGVKTSFVFDHLVRHSSTFPGPTSSIILNPEVKRVFSAAAAEIGWIRPKGEIVVSGWYSKMPIIEDKNVTSKPFGLSFTVKAFVF